MDNIKVNQFKSTTPLDLFKFTNKTFNVITYPEFKKIKSIDELFNKPNSKFELYPQVIETSRIYPFDPDSAVILYLSQPNSGHWTAIKRYKNRYDFLDSYGEILDDQLNYIDPKFKKQSNQTRNILTKLLYDKTKNNNTQVHYNNQQLQKLDNSATCGRYAALFIRSNLKVEQFVNTIKKLSKYFNMTPDELVTYITIQ